jgi:hypothetical protein
LGFLDEFDFVAFGGVNEGEVGAGGFADGGAVGVGYAFGGEVFAEFFEVVHLEGEVGEVGLDFDGAGAGVAGDFEEVVGVGGAEEGDFGAAGGFVAVEELEAEDVGVEVEGAVEVVNAVAGVEEFGDFHGKSAVNHRLHRFEEEEKEKRKSLTTNRHEGSEWTRIFKEWTWRIGELGVLGSSFVVLGFRSAYY